MTVVVALGGNALLRRGDPLDPAVQDRNVARAADALVRALPPDERVVITHGNGPQVGLLAIADASRRDGIPFPLDVLDAESEGMVGYLLARHLHRAGGRQIASLLTQVVVDPDDPAFERPTKPIGPVYGAPDSGALADRFGWTMAPEASGDGGWRRVVASPAPLAVVEVDAIGVLLDAGVVVVCAGGGGVPVAPDGERLVGVEAVVDKDATSALLAEQLAADQLVLLTDVDAVVDGWGTPDARPIGEVTAAELAAGDFADGSMGPKVAAACSFTQRTGRPSVIGSLDRLDAVIAGSAGTRIIP